jgi:hypothetical protein
MTVICPNTKVACPYGCESVELRMCHDLPSGEECPACGNHTLYHGYGLAGGGMGPYTYCTTDGCGEFDKMQDPEMSQ